MSTDRFACAVEFQVGAGRGKGRRAAQASGRRPHGRAAIAVPQVYSHGLYSYGCIVTALTDALLSLSHSAAPHVASGSDEAALLLKSSELAEIFDQWRTAVNILVHGNAALEDHDFNERVPRHNSY